MANNNVNFKKIDYSDGDAFMKELYNKSTIDSCTFDDFLKLPRQDGYENNINRIPNDFSTAIDHKENINHTGIMILPEPVLQDASGKIIDITFQDISKNIVNGTNE